MAVQNVTSAFENGLLTLKWTLIGEPLALSVQIAHDIEFTKTLRTFVLPRVSGISLDCGQGTWYFRIGSWLGTKQTGIIEFTPIHAPLTNPVMRLPVPVKAPEVSILHTQAITNGLRLHMSSSVKHYVVIETFKNTNVLAGSKGTTTYLLETGRGYVNVMGMDYNHTYAVRISQMTIDAGELPTDSVKMLDSGLTVYGKKPARPLKLGDSGAVTTNRGSNAILRDMEHKTNVHFASHSDYLRYKTAEAARSEEIRPSLVRER